jgi:hypothetical protein
VRTAHGLPEAVQAFQAALEDADKPEFITGRWAETLDALGNGLLEHVEAAERAGTGLVASAPSSE